MEIGLVRKIDIDSEMQQAYLDYAMSVIVARALPDARDGLKPVHRRILYAMYDMGVRTDSPYKKSARIVGEVLGKYHPHGDMAVYEAMARMAQDFSMRYTLVDGQGNFGSVDGDPPAAMRYTEARLDAPAQDMLADIQKNTVNFSDNFDATLREPDVLPAALPNLLVNGATGIAVGMATSIPPHNLGEVVDALRYMLDHWERQDDISVDDLMQMVQGPDFPTGGVILQEEGQEGLAQAYGSGRGRVIIQANAHLEEMERGRSRIVVTELPYMTNKASLIERIAELAREGKLEGVADLRDESDRQGMRIVVELGKSAEPTKILTDLYRHTPMRTTFSIILLALVDGEPRMLSLKQSLRVYLEHRLEIVRRRSEFDLEKARQRAHILEGLRIALHNLDEVIRIIRKAADAEKARLDLIKHFKLSEVQAQAILDMPLRRLAALERKKIEDEYKEVLAVIKVLEALLRSPKRMREVVGNELSQVRQAYGDERRTRIVHLKAGQSRISLLTAAELAPERPVWVAIAPDGQIWRSPDEHLPQLSGPAAPLFLRAANNRDTLYLVTRSGEAAAVSVHNLPESTGPTGSAAYTKFCALPETSPLAAVLNAPHKSARNEAEPPGFVLTVSRQGMVKKTALDELPGPSSQAAFTLARVNEGDELIGARLTSGQEDLLLASANGMAIRFSEEEVRPMGLVAGGVLGMKLQPGDRLAGLALIPKDEGALLLVASDGSAKRVAVDEFPRQGRYGQGVSAWKLAPATQVVGAAVGADKQQAVLHTAQGVRVFTFKAAPLVGRSARGQVLNVLKKLPEVTAFLAAPPFAPASPAGDVAAGAGGSRSRSAAAQSSAPGGGDGAAALNAAPAHAPRRRAAAEKDTPAPKPATKQAAQAPAPAAKGPAKSAAKAGGAADTPAAQSTAKRATKAPAEPPAAKSKGKTSSPAQPPKTAAQPAEKPTTKRAAKSTTAVPQAAATPPEMPAAKMKAKTAPSSKPEAKPAARRTAPAVGSAAKTTPASKTAAKATAETTIAAPKPATKSPAKSATTTTPAPDVKPAANPKAKPDAARPATPTSQPGEKTPAPAKKKR